MRGAVSFLLLALVGVAIAEVARNDVREMLRGLLGGTDALAIRASKGHYCGEDLITRYVEVCTEDSGNVLQRRDVEAFMPEEAAKRFIGNNKRDIYDDWYESYKGLPNECCEEQCSWEEVKEVCHPGYYTK